MSTAPAPMRRADWLRLALLSAIWGGSFIFMRLLAPLLGPVWTAEGRVLIGGVTLAGWMAFAGQDFELRRHWRHYLLLWLSNTALPFLLYAWSALHLPAGAQSVLNATAPLFGCLFAAIWLGEPLRAGRVSGVLLGLSGVAVMARGAVPDVRLSSLLAVLACLVAAACYALSGIYLKRRATAVPPKALAAMSLLGAAAWLLPAAFWQPPVQAVSAQSLGLLVAFGLVCSGYAYLLYYRLMRDIGPTHGLTVTFLIPVFGLFWGVLLLGETVTPLMGLGSLLVLGGTLLVTRP